MIEPIKSNDAIIYPDLALAALRQRRDRDLRLWTLARAFDAEGGGKIDRAAFQEWLDGLGLRGLSPQATRGLLAAGEGAFWRRAKGFFYLRSLLQVCRALGVETLGNRRAVVELDKLKTLKGWRAMCFASKFPNQKFSRPISRRTLAKMTGRTAPTQIRYGKAVELETRQNAAITHRNPDGDRERGEFVALVERRPGEASQPTVLRRLPNSYRSDVEMAGRGNQGRKVGKLLRNAWIDGAGPLRDPLYLEGPKAGTRAAHRIESAVASRRDDEFFVECADWDSPRAARAGMLWAGLIVLGGAVLAS